MLAIKEELLRTGHACSMIAITRSDSTEHRPNVYHPRTPIQLIRLLRTLTYDVLHLHIGGAIPLRVMTMILLCGLIARGRAVMTLHSGGYAIETVEKAHRWSFPGFAFGQFTNIIVVNPLMRTLFQKFGVHPDRIHMIYPFVLESPKQNVVVPGHFTQFASRHEKMLLTVGLLEPQYDLFMQIDALEAVLRDVPHTGLIIVGSGSLHNALATTIASKPYAEHILLAGDTDHDVVLHLIERSDVLLRTTTYDGDAISIREAIHLGTRVIATDTGMRPDGIVLIPKSDRSALERAVSVALAQPRLPSATSDDGWENIRKVLDVYEQVHTRRGY